MPLADRLKHAWNAFKNKDPTVYYDTGPAYGYRPDRRRSPAGNERSIITSIFNRIAMDVAAVRFVHAKVDDHGNFLEEIHSGLNDCLNIEANIDQTARMFIQDITLSMLDEGCVAVIPIDTGIRPKDTSTIDILSMRTGKILEWRPKHVKVQVYNDNTGLKEDIVIPKTMVAVVENPLYSVVNEPNSTLQRLIRKLNLLDVSDEKTSSGKLDLIIQLPYVIKSQTRRDQAEMRRKDIEKQLAEGKYGIAYTDGTERITQLNRPVENNLMKQIEYLRDMLYSQLGLTQAIMDGSADESTMLNYYNRTVLPIAAAITEEMRRKFLSKTARSQKQTILAYRDPFDLMPITNFADLADKLTRNEIVSSNEIRQKINMAPSNDPKANMLINSTLSKNAEIETNRTIKNEESGQNGEDV